MAAPTVASLYDIESNYESALANYFANVNTSWQVLTPRTLANSVAGTDFLRTPRITVEFAVTGTGVQREFSAGVNYHGVEYYAHKMGLVTLTMATQRANIQQDYGLMRGTARYALTETPQVFNANSLPYYQTIDVSEGNSGQGVNKDNDEVITHATFPVEFFILPTAFP